MKRKTKVSVFKRSASGLLALLLSLTPLAATGVVTGVLLVASTAYATGGSEFGNGDEEVQQGTPEATGAGFASVQAAVCNAAKALQGPVGIGIGFLVLVGGIIMVQVASRDALPMIARAAFGTALLLGAGAAFAAIVADPCQDPTTQTPIQDELILAEVAPEALFSL